MSSAAPDRRRGPRIALASPEPEVTLPLSATVQVIDISESGVLLASSQPLDVGRRAQLRTRLGTEPVTVIVEVRRVVSAPSGRGPGTYRLGTEFVALDDDVRRKLTAFLKQDQ